MTYFVPVKFLNPPPRSDFAPVGAFEALERRWITDRGECWNVTNMERLIADVNSALYVDKPRSVDVATFTGPFVLVIVGIAISVAIAFAEILYYRQHGRVSIYNYDAQVSIYAQSE